MLPIGHDVLAGLEAPFGQTPDASKRPGADPVIPRRWDLTMASSVESPYVGTGSPACAARASIWATRIATPWISDAESGVDH
jgi:hypothetical protein